MGTRGVVGHRRTATSSLLPLQLDRSALSGFGGDGGTAGLARRRQASRQDGLGGSVLGGIVIFGHLASSSLVRTSSASADGRRRRLRRLDFDSGSIFGTAPSSAAAWLAARRRRPSSASARGEATRRRLVDGCDGSDDHFGRQKECDDKSLSSLDVCRLVHDRDRTSEHWLCGTGFIARTA